MAKPKRLRTKSCDRCGTASSVLYRVRTKKDGSWILVCPACLGGVKPDNPFYQYGGTWKSSKRH